MKNYASLCFAVAHVAWNYPGIAKAAKDADAKKTVLELNEKISLEDPAVKANPELWIKVRRNLDQAAAESSSEDALKLSLQNILDQWTGLRYRVLDSSDSQYWGLFPFGTKPNTVALPNAWIARRGGKWYAQYVGKQSASVMKRGDQLDADSFAPFSPAAQAQKSWSLDVKSSPMKSSTKTELTLTRQPILTWSSQLTQQASQMIPLEGQALCYEKVWFALDPSNSEWMASRIKSLKDRCKAMLIDLRDVWGAGLKEWPLPPQNFPIAVLANSGTREGAVRLLRTLKQTKYVRSFGETTGSSQFPESAEALSNGWLLIASRPGGEQIAPDVPIKDSFIYAESHDDVHEAALKWLRAQLK